MKLSFLASAAALLAPALAANDLPSIDVVGNKFFYSNNGSQFYIKGVAYQSNSVANATSSTAFNDPLADTDACKRDIPYLQKLGTNVVRVYAINTTLDHSECMSALNDAGIYVISDLSEPGMSIQVDDPQWNLGLFNRYTSAVDALANYTNLLGFFGGNEVINAPNSTQAAPFVKAAIRDTKAYIKQKYNRTIPVGYASTDAQMIRIPEADYFACGDESEAADFYGVNIYEWCGESTYQTSGYEAWTDAMKNMTIPLFFSEYGCNNVKPRKFQEVSALYGDNMTDVWSGGIVYMYFQEENDYGLVSVSGSSVSTLADYNNLQTALASVSPSSAHSSDITTTGSSMNCPPTSAGKWTAATDLPPTPNADVCDCISPAAACVVKDDVSSKDYGDIFGYICGEISCAGITGNGTSGTYGAFAGCNPKDQLNYVLGLYYEANSQDSSACDFQGSATVNSQTSTAGSCKAVFSQAGSSGTGSVSQGTSVNAGPTASSKSASGNNRGASGSSSGSGSKSGSSSSGSSSNAAASSGHIKTAAAGVFGVMGAFFIGLL